VDSLGKGPLVQAEHPGRPGTWGKPVEGLGRGQGGWWASVPTGTGALSPPPSIRQSDAAASQRWAGASRGRAASTTTPIGRAAIGAAWGAGRRSGGRRPGEGFPISRRSAGRFPRGIRGRHPLPYPASRRLADVPLSARVAFFSSRTRAMLGLLRLGGDDPVPAPTDHPLAAFPEASSLARAGE